MKLTTLAYKEGFIFVTSNVDIEEGDLITQNGNAIWQSSSIIKKEHAISLFKVIACTSNVFPELRLPIITGDFTAYTDIELEVDTNGNPIKINLPGNRITYKQLRVTASKKYTIEVNELSDNTNKMLRINDGFNAYELIGILTMAIHEIEQQIKGQMKPTLVEKIVVKP